MARKNRLFAKLASDVDTSGNLAASGIQSAALDTGVTVYATRASLPTSGNTAGDQAYVTGNNRLYIWNGSGWYNIALLNVAPSIQSVLDSGGGTTPFSLAIDGTATTITITAADSDGDPITYSATSDSGFSGLATLSQADNVFTITPFSQDSATTSSGTITFTATDGINVASSGIQTFTLSFLSALWDETVLSIGTSSTNGLTNSTFIDDGANSLTVTPTGNSTQSSFHPFLDYYSVHMPSGATASVPGTNLAPGTSEFCYEGWVYITDNTQAIMFISQWNNGSGQHGPFITGGQLWFYRGNYGSGEAYKRTTTTIPLNTWTHIAITRDSSNVWRFFFDGVEQSTSITSAGSVAWSDSINLTSTQTVYLGGNSNYNNNEVYLSNLRLVIGDAVYTSNFTPPTEPLTAITGTALLCYKDNRLIDNSANNLTITSTTARVRAFNPFGQLSEYAPRQQKGSAYFDGNGDFVTIAGDGVNNLFTLGTGDWTAELWYYREGTGTQQYGDANIITTATPTDAVGFAVLDRGGTYAVLAGAGSGWAFNTSTGVPMKHGQWTHIAFVHTNSNTFTLYENGIQVWTGTNTVSLTNPNDALTFGGRGGSLTQYFLGYISDVRFYKGTAQYTGNFTPPTAPHNDSAATAYVPCDNLGIYDKTGNNTLILAGNTSTSTTQTKFATTSMYFDGTGDTAYIAGGASHKFNIGGITHWTAEFWCNTTASGHQRLLTFHGPENWGLIKPVAQTTGIEWNHFGPGAAFTSGAGTLPANTWTHVALVRNGSTITCYLNGTSAGSTTSIPTSGAYEVWIGSSTGSYARSDTNGYFENVQFLSGVAKYTTNFTPPTQTQGRTYQAES